ncbi:MAG: Zn-finger nucleic acid-binding protein [Candidatus Paceibacteria bacterium]|jgi:Zn-finger nucleic acid-binding protein
MLLIACPSCSRQYDATGLPPASDVRCFCDEVFCVRWPDRLSGAALTCTNCGGEVSPQDESCSFCACAISEEDRRKTTLCPGCFTRIDDDSKHCRACALEIHPQQLAPLPADRDCPRCEGPLRVRSFDVVDVTECGDCLGMWFTPALFQRVTEEAGRKNAGTELTILGKTAATPTLKKETVKYIPCLKCGELMQRRQYTHKSRSSGTVIDVCRGHGVWLDHEEIDRILQLVATAPEEATPPTSMDPAVFISTQRALGGMSEYRSGWRRPSGLVRLIDFLSGMLAGHL